MSGAAWFRVLRALVDAMDPGASIERTQRNHYALRLTNGATVHASGSPSCGRAEQNGRGDIRRALRNT